MKKSLLFGAALLVAGALSAQDFNAATYVASASDSIKEIATDTQIEFENYTLGFAGLGWTFKESAGSFTYNGVTYNFAQYQGTVNGVDGALYKGEDPSCAVVLAAKAAGQIDVAFKFGWNKKFWVIDIPSQEILDELDLADATALEPYKTAYWGGYWSATGDETTGEYLEAQPEAEAAGLHYAGLTLDVQAGHIYYVWFSGSKIMFCGSTYHAATAINSAISEANVVSSRYFLLSGEEVSAPQAGNRGLYIVKNLHADGSVSVNKIILK